MKSVIESYKKSMNQRLAHAKLNVKGKPNIYADKFGYLLIKYSICKCKEND